MPTEPTQADLDRFVRANVYLCLSSLVSTLANGADTLRPTQRHPRRDEAADLADLTEQAFELSRPIEDYEEAAQQAGWEQGDGGRWSHGDDWVDTPRKACELHNLDPYEWEIFEHWAVSEWFAEQLEAKGERVDLDFAGLCVWGRTTTGQSIAMDSVVAAIWRDLHKEEG